MRMPTMFIGRVAAAPIIQGAGDKAVTKVTLIRNEYAGKDINGEARERVVSIQFSAFKTKAEAIANNVNKGDQLIVDYRIENNNYKNSADEDVYGYNFIIEDFEFGAPGSISRSKWADKATA